MDWIKQISTSSVPRMTTTRQTLLLACQPNRLDAMGQALAQFPEIRHTIRTRGSRAVAEAVLPVHGPRRPPDSTPPRPPGFAWRATCPLDRLLWAPGFGGSASTPFEVLIWLYIYTISGMAKVTLSIDGRVLGKIRERAVRKRGKLRSLSEEIEEILRDSLANDQVLEGLKALCCGRDDHFVTFDEVDAAVFPGAPPAEEILRNMRRHRA
jgi:hypothetical protein